MQHLPQRMYEKTLGCGVFLLSLAAVPECTPFGVLTRPGINGGVNNRGGMGKSGTAIVRSCAAAVPILPNVKPKVGVTVLPVVESEVVVFTVVVVFGNVVLIVGFLVGFGLDLGRLLRRRRLRRRRLRRRRRARLRLDGGFVIGPNHLPRGILKPCRSGGAFRGRAGTGAFVVPIWKGSVPPNSGLVIPIIGWVSTRVNIRVVVDKIVAFVRTTVFLVELRLDGLPFSRFVGLI